MIAFAHALPDGLLLDGRGGGRVALALAIGVFVALVLVPRGERVRRAVVVGTALLSGGLGAWLADGLMTGTLVPAGFSLFGAVLGGPVGAALATRAQGLDVRTTLDRLAAPGLAAAIVARAGCLVAGCDFGRAADGLPFTLRYAAGTPAFESLARRGEVSAGAAMTGPLHAFPLYEMALVALGLVLLLLLRRRLAPGVYASLAGASYFGARAVAELFRDGPTTSPSTLVIAALTCGVSALALAARVHSSDRSEKPSPCPSVNAS